MMSAKDLIRVLEIGSMFGEMKLGSNPRRICKHLNSFFIHKLNAKACNATNH